MSVSRCSTSVTALDSPGDDEETEPFVSGVRDDVISRLQKIGGLKPISRTLLMEYRDSRQNLQQIAEEL